MHINIGTSTDFFKKITLDKIYDKNSILFLKIHELEDKFSYSFYENILTIVRIDKNEGWEYSHEGFIYENSTKFEYLIGGSKNNTKLIPLEEYFPECCNLVLKENEFQDSFDFNFKDNNLIVTRIDKNHGWDYNHICCVSKNKQLEELINPENFVKIGSSGVNEKIIILDKNYDENSIIFLKTHSQQDKFHYFFDQNILTITRIDKNEGWDFDHYGYVYNGFLPYEYDIKNSFENTKNIPLYDYYPEESAFLIKNNCFTDKFNFNFKDNFLMVTRLDKNEGWGHFHKCSVHKKNKSLDNFNNELNLNISIENLSQSEIFIPLNIGSSNSYIKKIILTKSYNENTIIFLKTHSQQDSFTYIFKENELTIIRIDKNEGWEFDHSGFIYDSSTQYEYDIGDSCENTKIIPLNGFFPEGCDIILNDNPHQNDSFSFKFENNNLIVKRLDKTGGWGYHHKCKIVKNYFLQLISDPDNFINIGSSDSKEKKIILNKNYDENTIIFLKTHSHDHKFTYFFKENELTIIRIDKNEGWDYEHLAVVYNNQSKKYTFTIGCCLENKKFINLNGYFPEGCILLPEKNNYDDTFDCNYKDNTLIVERIDKNNGWGHNHTLEVYKNTLLSTINNPKYFIKIGSSTTNTKKILLDRTYHDNTIIFFKTHELEDKFIYQFNENELIIKRVDKNSGWDHEHTGFLYDDIESPFKYNIGHNYNGIEKNIETFDYFPENCELIKENNLFSDKFNFSFKQNILNIKRLDKNEGWEHFHKLKIYKSKIPNIVMNLDNFINIGSSPQNEKLIILDKSYNKNTILFFKTHNYEDKFSYYFNENILIIKRFDKDEGWNNNHIAYIYDNPEPYKYDIGTNFNSSEKKIQLFGYFPEDCSLPIPIYPFTDKFYFSFDDNLLKVRRSDKNEGWRHHHSSNLIKRVIPKIVFQTHYKDIPGYVKNKVKNKSNGWNYLFFTDPDIIKFILENPIPQFPKSVDKFFSIKNGAHKADFFRYYFLFIKGGVFLDSDAEFIKNLDDIIGENEFVTSICADQSLYFNGFICCPPNNKIIYEALKDMYFMDVNQLSRDYFKVVRNFKTVVEKNKYNGVKLYKEDGNWTGTMNMIDPANNNEIIIKHYYSNKVVPP
jgi:hypothetical protein